MKDKIILKKLNNYADALERKDEILHGAYREMAYKAQALHSARQEAERAASTRRSRLRRKFVAALMLAASFLAVFFFFQNTFNDTTSAPIASQPPVYHLSELSKSAATMTQLEEIASVKMLDDYILLEDYELKTAYLYSDSETSDVYVAIIKYRTIRNGNTEDVTIVSDLMGGLKDYEQNGNLGQLFFSSDNYINGEYHSRITLKEENRAYSVLIISPQPNATSTYSALFR